MIDVAVPRAVDPAGPPPTFVVRTDRSLCVVEIAVDPVLFQASLVFRRTPDTFHSSAAPGPLGVHGGEVAYTLDPHTWERLRRHPYLYYRASVFDRGLLGPVRIETTVRDADYRRAPSVYVARPPGMLPRAPRGLSRAVPPLRVDRNRVVNSAGDVVVLRGAAHRGMEVSGGSVRRDEIRALVRRFRANVVRIALNQRFALMQPSYLRDLDRVIAWAADEGAYTLLAVTRLDERRRFGTHASGVANWTAPLPEENTLRLWDLLAQRYHLEPAVLYELFDEPHEPYADDASFLFQRAGDDAGWHALWHGWVRRIAQAVRRVHPQALLVVSGWRWGLDLRAFPIRVAAVPIANTVYSTHVFPTHREGRATASEADWYHWFGFERLRLEQPIFVGAWGGDATQLDWGNRLERYLRERHRFQNGVWPGLAGWTASSWGELVDAGGNPTEFGELVEGSLRTMASAASADFDATRPRGSRSRYLVTTSPAVHDDFFLVRGHDFVAGTRIVFTPSAGSPVRITPRTTLPHLLVVTRLPSSIPVGPATVVVERPDGVRSEPVAVQVSAAPLPAVTVIAPGAAKAAPYTLLFLANPVIRRVDGTLAADPIQSSRPAFQRAVADAMRVLFGQRETLLQPYVADIRLVARFAPEAVAAANALCEQDPSGTMQPASARVVAYLGGLGLSPDHCFLAYRSGTHGRDSTSWATDDTTSRSRAFTYDASARKHYQRAATPGVTALSTPTRGITALHEYLHGLMEMDDLYVDGAPTTFVVNRKRGPTLATPRPASFATLDGRVHATDLRRDGLGYRRGWLSYHPTLIDRRRPNVMDDYWRADDTARCRLDVLGLRFVRDRLEWMMQR